MIPNNLKDVQNGARNDQKQVAATYLTNPVSKRYTSRSPLRQIKVTAKLQKRMHVNLGIYSQKIRTTSIGALLKRPL